METMQKQLIELKDFIEKEERDTIDKDWLIRWIEKQLLPIEQEPIIDSEGNKYSTIKIGGQEWLIDLAGFKDSKDGWHIPTDEDIAKLNKFIEQEPPKEVKSAEDFICHKFDDLNEKKKGTWKWKDIINDSSIYRSWNLITEWMEEYAFQFQTEQRQVTDEEIKKWVKEHGYYGHCTSEWHEGLEEGAKAMRENKIGK